MAVLIILIVLTSFIFPVSEAQQRNSGIIGLGSSLTPTSNDTYWSSDSGRFAFGFYQERNGYAIGIWLPKIQQKTVVWTANRDDPLLSSDQRLILTSDGGLVLQSNQGQKQLSAETSGQLASSASVLDSGNFVLYNSELEIIWQSFRFPTDTIVSGQTFFAGSQLVSSISETNHTSGKFKIVMRDNGNLVQYPANLPERVENRYWRAVTDNAAGNVTLKLDSNGWLYLQSANSIERNLTNGWNTSGIAIYPATIDADGIFRLYSHNLDQNGNWTVEWQSSNNRCDPMGICDFNGYCFLDQDGEPVCACPLGFHFIDENRKNLGCRRNSSVDNCTSSKAAFAIQELKDVSFQDNPYFISSISKDECWEACEKDCNCKAALYISGRCRKQRLPLRYGRTVIRENSEFATLIKVKNGETANSDGYKEKKALQTGIFITGIVLSTFACFLLGILGCLVYKYQIWKYTKLSSMRNDELLEDVTLRSYTFDEIKRATNNFMNQIEKGAYGTVFRGVISNGSRIVAIKRLEIVVAEGEREFCNEMKVIGRTHHKNLVRLLGYCHDGTNRLLVYEYMNNGSLEDFLFKCERKPVWDDRIKTGLNVARGILYFHEECAPQIIHCDIKPGNILMDDKQCAKIADFGLSKFLMSDQSKTSTGLRGTICYVAPEWVKHSPITVKADVYSFGVMLLEIMCCQRRPDVDFVYDCFEAGELNSLVQNEEVETSKLDRLVRVGLWCIQDEPASRTSMKKVVLMLEGAMDIPVPPRPFSFGSLSETSV